MYAQRTNYDQMNKYKYDPWGNLLAETETVSNPYRYAGYRWDKETGLYYLNTRYYAPHISRFLTSDSRFAGFVQQPITLNRYVYANDNPVVLIDQDGQLAWIPGALGAGAGFLGYAATTLATGQDWDWRSAAVATTAGAAAAYSPSVWVAGAIGAAAYVTDVAGRQPITVGGVAANAALGGAGHAVSDLLGNRYAESVFRGALRGAARTVVDISTNALTTWLSPPLQRGLDRLLVGSAPKLSRPVGWGY